MKFQQDASVATADGQAAGHIDRVVIDPKTKEVTHLVIRKGLLFTDDRVAPIELVSQATEEHIELKINADELNNLPKFEEAHYIRLATGENQSGSSLDSNHAGLLYWYPTGGVPMENGGQPGYAKRMEQNIPEGTVALRTGAKVIAEDGKLVGRVEEILTYGGTNQATHILIAKGLLAKERKLIPTFWIRIFEEDEVHLAAPASVLEKIQPYQN